MLIDVTPTDEGFWAHSRRMDAAELRDLLDDQDPAPHPELNENLVPVWVLMEAER